MMQERRYEFLRRYRPSFWGFVALAAVGGVASLWVLALLVINSEQSIKTALDTGQRVHIELSTGAVEGNMRHAGPIKSAVPAPTELTPAPVNKKSSPAPQNSNKAAGKDSDQIPPPEEIPSGDGGLREPKSSILLETAEGKLPIISSEGVKPSEYYAKPYTRIGKAPIVGFLVLGLGQQREYSTTALELPDGVSLALSPYADYAEIWARNARYLGHEVFLELPLESPQYPATDPGPWALLSTASPEDNINNLLHIMQRVTGYVGLVAGVNENFTLSINALSPVLNEINRRGLVMLCADKTSGMGQILGRKDSIRGGCADVVLDAEMTPEAIYAALSKLEEHARANGQAFGILRARPLSLSIVSGWIGGMKSRNLRLAPVSAIIPQPPPPPAEGEAVPAEKKSEKDKKNKKDDKKSDKKKDKKKEPAKEGGEKPEKNGHE